MIAHPERPGAVAGAVPPSGHRFEHGYGWPMIAHLCSAAGTKSGHSYTFLSSFSFSEYFRGAQGGGTGSPNLEQQKQVRFQQTHNQGFASAVFDGVLGGPPRLARYT